MAVEKNIKQKEKQNLYKIMKQQNEKEKKSQIKSIIKRNKKVKQHKKRTINVTRNHQLITNSSLVGVVVAVVATLCTKSVVFVSSVSQ
jgi:hypothetical protein